MNIGRVQFRHSRCTRWHGYAARKNALGAAVCVFGHHIMILKWGVK